MSGPFDSVSPETRRNALILGAFVTLALVAASLLFAGRPHVIAVAVAAWTGFFAVLRHYGYGPLALNAALLFSLLIAAEHVNHAPVPGHLVVATSALLMALFTFVVILHQWLPQKVRFLALLVCYVLNVLICLTALVYLWHNRRFDAPVTASVLYAIYQTNAVEAAEFLEEFTHPAQALAAVLLLLLPGVLLLRQRDKAVKRINVLLLATLVVIPALIAGRFHEQLGMIRLVATTAATYRQELALFRQLQEQRTAGRLVVDATKDGTSETYVIVIGESLNRNHMRLYGYHRETTPQLDSLHRAREVIRFTSAFATHTHTALVLPHALTAASQQNEADVITSPSLLDIARAAGFETYWLTNQALYGPWDNLVSILAHGADSLVGLNRNVGMTSDSERHDGAVVPVLEALLASGSEHNRLVVVHLMGSHWQYCDRFPATFARYTGNRLPRGEFGAERKAWLASGTNCYDNSVLYNDHVVAELLRVTRSAGGRSAFVYFADHGDDVLTGAGHHSEKFTYPMVEIPLIAWFSGEYVDAYPQRVAALRRRQDAAFPIDYFYDTALGITGIRTVHYDSVADLSHDAYHENDVDLRLMGLTRRFVEPQNTRYHQRRNIARLGSTGLLSRVLPHRVNSTGMLAQLRYDGHRSLEIDLNHRQADADGYFEVGHDEEHLSGKRLDEFLALMSADTVERLWLDLKNLDASNAAQVQQELLRLDERFGLRRAAIVESPAVELLAPIAQEGFHTSFYLPTERLLALTAAGVRDSVSAEAHRLATRVRNARVAAVSFDAGLYGFVKQHLEPLLDPGVVYHCWDLDLSLADPDFIARLHASPPFRDPRVRTLLVGYRSEFIL